MTERLTMQEVIYHCEETVQQIEYMHKSLYNDDNYEHIVSNRYWEHRQLAEWLRELQKYKDLEEQGRLVILPEGMNLRKLLDIITEHSINCPCDYNLVNRCELSCFECWLAALKGEDNKWRDF